MLGLIRLARKRAPKWTKFYFDPHNTQQTLTLFLINIAALLNKANYVYDGLELFI